MFYFFSYFFSVWSESPHSLIGVICTSVARKSELVLWEAGKRGTWKEKKDALVKYISINFHVERAKVFDRKHYLK